MNRIHSRLVCMAATAQTALILAGQALALDEGPAIANTNGICRYR